VKAINFDIKQAPSINEVNQLKKLKGQEKYYRIRCGDYRIGIEIIENRFIMDESISKMIAMS
jgi:mRNA interferase RelE/StbE